MNGKVFKSTFYSMETQELNKRVEWNFDFIFLSTSCLDRGYRHTAHISVRVLGKKRTGKKRTGNKRTGKSAEEKSALGKEHTRKKAH